MVINADSLHLPIKDCSVQCCVTSPPYYGLRSYLNNGHKHKSMEIGQEQTPSQYIEKMLGVFREVRRILKDDGVVWLNIGDCYAGSGGMGSFVVNKAKKGMEIIKNYHRNKCVDGIKPKNLIGIPWRLALAMQDDGWYLRSDCIWNKPNCMPSSVKDRPTTSHEYLFLLSKSPKYFYDYESVKQPAKQNRWGGHKPMNKNNSKDAGNTFRGLTRERDMMPQYKNMRTVWTVNTKPCKQAHFAVMPEKLVEPCILAGSKKGDIVFDPFCGSGTVGVVANRYGREFIGVELNIDYIKIAKKRLKNNQMELF